MNLDENDSDESSDEDYIPTKDSDVEVNSEISEDDFVDDANSDNEKKNEGCKKRKLKKKCESNSFKKKGGIKLKDDTNSEENLQKDLKVDSSDNQRIQVNTPENEEKEKERANKLWSDFLKDAEDPSKCVKPDFKSPENVENGSNEVGNIITKEFNFAGEVIRVTEVVDSNSQKSIKVVSESASLQSVEKSDSPILPTNVLVKKPGGLDSILNKISGLKKISTLEKSRLDWNVFKADQGISEDLQTFNRGRNGFIEKQKFLQRTDERRFELEKEFRKSGSKR